MAFQVTTATEKIMAMEARIKIVQGSTSAGKTWAILPLIADDLLYEGGKKGLATGQTHPSVMAGPRTIFEEIMTDMNRWDQKAWNGMSGKYTFPNRSWLKFKAFDTTGKAKADDKRDYLFINEANHVPWAIADTLITRSKQTYLDYNPDAEFWAHTELLPQPNSELLVLNYLDNEALPWETLEDLMIKRAKAYYDPEGDIDDPDNIKSEYWSNWWRVYGLGLVGSLEGQIYRDWTTTNFWPELPRYVYGLDFGYTNDYTALSQNCYYRGALYTKEKYYKVGYDSDAFIEFLYLEGVTEKDVIISDHDHLAIAALEDAGFNVLKADKRPGSVLSGVNALCTRDVRVHWTSTNTLKEQRLYFWKTGKDSHDVTNEPVDANNHLMDTIRYADDYLFNPQKDWYLKQQKAQVMRGGRRKVVYSGR